jgi:hypothetical protein
MRQGWETTNSYVSVVIFTGKRPFGTSRYRWEDNIEIYLGDMEYIYIYI